VKKALIRYEKVRKDRATKVQEASARARRDIRERIGWNAEGDREGKLAIEEVCG
jgi:salicylate hydroxylase